MPVIDVFGGLLKGFGQQVSTQRAEQQRQIENQIARDQRIFEHLATSDDPEIQGAAINGLQSLATGSYTPKKGLSKFLGGPIEVNPAVTRLFQMLRSGGFEGFGGEAPGGESVPMPPATTAREGSGAVAAPPPPPAPAQAPPGSMGMPPSPSKPGGGIQLPPGLSVGVPFHAPVPKTPWGVEPPAPPPVPAAATVSAPPAPSATTTTAAAAPPPAPRTPRRVFLSPAERTRQDYVARAQGDVEGDVAGYVATGMSREEAVAQVKAERLRRGGLGSNTWAEGEVIQKPDGSWVQILYNRLDPQQRQEIPATAPALRSVAPPNADAQLAHELYSPLYPGKQPVEVLAALSPQQRQVMQEERLRRTQAQSLAAGRGTGQAAIETELGKPVGVTVGAAQGIDPTTALRDLNGITPITPEQRERVENAKNLLTQLIEVRALVQAVFPPSSGLIGGLTAAGTLAAKRASRDPQLAQLEAKIGPLKSIVTRVIAGERGNMATSDITRSEVALPKLEAALLSGDTQESALARLDELMSTAQAVVNVVKLPADQINARRTGAPAAAAGAPPPLPANAPKKGDVVGNLYTGAQVGTTPDGKKVGLVDGRTVPLIQGPDGKYYW